MRVKTSDRTTFKLKRAYDKPEGPDGFRILVDRLWPRGLSKDRAKIDLWLKDIAPSSELRKWFGHDSGKWEEFQKRYAEELGTNRETVSRLRQTVKDKAVVTLLFSASDENQNNAVALKKILKL